MNDFAEAVQKRLLVGDGAMGTMLHAAGNSLDRALPELNLSNPSLVSTIHESYVGAGAELILTNTFGANRLRLAEHGHAGDVAEINRAGARLAREAAVARPRRVFVGGSISPAVTASKRPQVSAAERAEAIGEQVAVLADAGVDVLVLETFGYLDELLEAVQIAANTTDLPILAQATFTTDLRTPGGETPRDVAMALSELPTTAIGANCTIGPQRMLGIAEELRRATELPISVQPNAGLPRRVDGRRFEYNLDHDYFVRFALRCADVGASIIGGCCGTTPGHMRAVAVALSQRPQRPVVTGKAQSAPDDFARNLARHGFVVAAEVVPLASGTADEAAEIATELRSLGTELILLSAVASSRSPLPPSSLALYLQQQVGVETVTTATTWDKTIMSLQADLLGAHAFGARNVLCDTGNPPLRGDYPNADGIWEVDSVGLIELLSGLNTGRDCNGLPLATKTFFNIGARCNPGAEDIDTEIARTRAKISAGAQFLVTRPVYEMNGLRRMLDALRPEGVPVLVAVAPLSGFAEAEYLAYEVPDVTIPPETLTNLEASSGHEQETAVAMATELVTQARSLADGVVIVVGRDRRIARQLLTTARSGLR